MKFLIVLALLSCVAFVSADEEWYNECITTEQGFNSWKGDGTRIVTFGLSWCKKAWKSKFTFIDYIKESKNAQGWTYHFLNCNKFAEGTCKGLYNNFLDKSPPEVKFLDYRLPRTFCIKRQGKKIAVLPITKTGRLHSNERKSPEFFERWLARCNAL